MEGDAIGEIIQKEQDRLFIVDRECYIIFTGTSPEDERPFIRVGNYIDLPVEIIPLIENVVITDLLVGNPACEQFNIDIKQLPTNRYIGGRQVVNKYLNFQKIFGLDLTNATIVDVEKDIPYLSKQRELSARDSFMGIFYTNGNFKINHRDTNIMDLLRETGAAFDEGKALGLVSAAARDTKRYDGDGVVFIGGNPLFYRKGNFTCYHFPKRFIEEFASLSIDPTRIRVAVHPSSNFIHITRLFKWKHATGGKLRVYSGHREQMELAQKLFPGASINRQDFNGFAGDPADGPVTGNFPGTFNIGLSYPKTKPARLDLTLAYIKGARGLEQVLASRPDGVLVHYSVYEETSILFKSSRVPAVIVADGRLAASRGRIRGHALPVIHSGVQYEFRKYGSVDGLVGDIAARLDNVPAPEALTAADIEERYRALAASLREGAVSSALFRDAFNTLALCRAMLETEQERKRAGALRKAVQEIDLALDRESISSHTPASFRVILAFCGPLACEYMETPDDDAGKRASVIGEITEAMSGAAAAAGRSDEEAFNRRVLDDRERLKRLLELYRPRSEKGGLRELEKAMLQRKEEYYTDQPAIDEEAAPGAGKPAPWKRIAACAVVALSLAVSALLLSGHAGRWREERDRAARAAEELARKEIIARYRITVSPHDIFVYANAVALKNGYQRITFKGLKEKNPNWIYPGNRFLLDDGEAVTVKQGDTLWDIAGARLMDRHVRFYRLVDAIREKKSAGAGYAGELESAAKLSFSKEHHALIDELKGKTADGTAGQDKLLRGTR
ncbi:MAG TPA: LysM peptidoglycan-binding domain-containing protein [Spirochaetota bacterium]|nr:LysM peptidoglycan-binding domain-containing protein [Spirochaetota bacterium]